MERRSLDWSRGGLWRTAGGGWAGRPVGTGRPLEGRRETQEEEQVNKLKEQMGQMKVDAGEEGILETLEPRKDTFRARRDIRTLVSAPLDPPHDL